MRLEELERALRELAGQTPAISEKREATRQTLVASAVEQFSKRGIRKTTMEDVATAAGVSRGTLYTYAKKRDDLLLMCLAEASLTQLASHAEIVAPNLAPDVRLEALIVSKILAVERSPILAKLLEGDTTIVIALRNHPRFLRIFGSKAFDEIRDLSMWVKAAAPHLDEEESVEVEAALSALLVSAPVMLRAIKGFGHETEPIVRRLAATFVAGLRPQKKKRRRTVASTPTKK